MEFDVIKVTFHMTKKTLEFAFMYSNSSSTQVLNVGELKKASVLVSDKKPAFLKKVGLPVFIFLLSDMVRISLKYLKTVF